MFWLSFKNSGTMQVMLIEAGHLAMARIKAGMLGQKGEFQEGFRIDAKRAKNIPKNMVARPHTKSQAQTLIKRMDT